MAGATRGEIVRTLLEGYGTLWSQQMGFTLRDKPAPLFRWLCGSLLLSARIGEDIAVRAARALADAGWTTPQKLADSTWANRTRVLNRSGYARYDERTSRMLGEDAAMLLDRYGGDLRRLREEAGRDPEEERRRLMEFKGIGEVGVDIFFREAQGIWEELYPFADRKSLQAAERLQLGRDARSLSKLVPQADFPRLTAALVRVDLQKAHEEERSQATQAA
jgi:hypothetical protein